MVQRLTLSLQFSTHWKLGFPSSAKPNACQNGQSHDIASSQQSLKRLPWRNWQARSRLSSRRTKAPPIHKPTPVAGFLPGPSSPSNDAIPFPSPSAGTLPAWIERVEPRRQGTRRLGRDQQRGQDRRSLRLQTCGIRRNRYQDCRALKNHAKRKRAERSQSQKDNLMIRYETDTVVDTVMDWNLRFKKHCTPHARNFPADSPFQLESAECRERGIAIWHRLLPPDRKRFWRSALQVLTLFQPSAAISVLIDALEERDLMPFKGFGLESLSLIVLRLFWSQRRQPNALIEKVLDAWGTVLKRPHKGPRCSDSLPYAVFALARHLDLEQLTTFWTFLSDRPDYLTYKTAMALVHSFARFGDAKTGLLVLDTIPLVNISDLRTQYALIKLLRMDLHVDNPYDFRLKVLNRFLERGLQPSIYVQNMAILHAMEAGDTQTGWDIFNLMRDNGMRPNEKTYRILLNGASDRETVTDIYRKALEDGIDTKLPRTATRFFIAWAEAPNSEGAIDTFENLLPYYAATFDVRPLRELSMLQGSTDDPDPEAVKHPPTIEVVAIMIIHFLRHEKFYVRVDTVYRNFLRLVGERHPIVAPLAHNTATANAFLMSFGQSSLHITTCLSIMADMTNPPRPETSPPHNKQPLVKALGKTWYNPPTDDFFVAPPDFRTWNIMLDKFLFHRRTAAAEKVLQLMRKNGIEITKVTWNTLINGYAHVQDEGKVVSTLKEMKEAGLEHDERTIRSLSHLQNKKALLKYLEQSGQGVSDEWTESDEGYREEMDEALESDSKEWEWRDGEVSTDRGERRDAVQEYLYGGDPSGKEET